MYVWLMPFKIASAPSLQRLAHADHRIWQDVYRPRTAVGDVYLKLTVIDDVLIVSFKEL